MSANLKRVRRAVCERAGGNCEACGAWIGEAGEEGQADHYFGRAKAEETVATVWIICPGCHSRKTLNTPDAAFWIRAFVAHCERHGFTAERELALTKLSTLIAKGRAAA